MAVRAAGLNLERGGGRKTEAAQSRTTWGCVILECRGRLWVGGQAVLQNVPLLIHALNKHDACH